MSNTPPVPCQGESCPLFPDTCPPVPPTAEENEYSCYTSPRSFPEVLGIRWAYAPSILCGTWQCEMFLNLYTSNNQRINSPQQVIPGALVIGCLFHVFQSIPDWHHDISNTARQPLTHWLRLTWLPQQWPLLCMCWCCWWQSSVDSKLNCSASPAPTWNSHSPTHPPIDHMSKEKYSSLNQHVSFNSQTFMAHCRCCQAW